MTTPILPTTNEGERQSAKSDLTREKVQTLLQQINQGITVLENPSSTSAQRWQIVVELLQLQKKLVRYIATLD